MIAWSRRRFLQGAAVGFFIGAIVGMSLVIAVVVHEVTQ